MPPPTHPSKRANAAPDISGEPGQLIAGKYRLESILGSGAMGTVWKAEHTALGQAVAVKLISREYAVSKEARHRFRTEATAAAKLRSRFVVQVSDSGETDDDIPYLVMELMHGETLDQRLEREGALPLEDVVRITAQVARGLMHAHENGIVHRDLKPGNIYLARTMDDDTGVIAKVLDFGVAKLNVNDSTSTTRTGTVLGTPQFMSPEQVRGLKTVDHRSDLYSLGMVVFTMLTGRIAYDGDAFGDLLLAICTKDLPTVHDYAPHVPEAVDSWFQTACARELSDRFDNALELAEVLIEASGLKNELGGLSTIVAGGSTVLHVPASKDLGSLPPPRPANDDMPTLRRGLDKGTVMAGSVASRPRPAPLGNRIAIVVLSVVAAAAIASAGFVWFKYRAALSVAPAAANSTLPVPTAAASQPAPSPSAAIDTPPVIIDLDGLEPIPVPSVKKKPRRRYYPQVKPSAKPATTAPAKKKEPDLGF